MIISIISALSMAAMAAYMFMFAKMSEARRMAWLPAACAGMELLAMGLLTPAAFPLLTALLVMLRVLLLATCAVAMRRDAAMVRARRRRRQRLARELHLALNPIHEVPAAAAVAARRADIRIA